MSAQIGSPLVFGEGSRGTITQPDQDAPAPAVLLLHGFASHADEVGGFFVQLAEALAAVGIASLRFTFKGFERPLEERVDSSIPDMLAETAAAADALGAHPEIDAGRLGLLGFSLGGAVAVVAAAGQPERFRSLATWSCAADLENRFRALAGDDVFDRALTGEAVRLDLGWRVIRLGPALFESLVGCRPEEAIRDWDGPFLAIAGSEDPLSAHLDAYHRNAAGEYKEKLLIPGADHIFNVLEAPARFAPDVIEKTMGWFRQNL